MKKQIYVYLFVLILLLIPMREHNFICSNNMLNLNSKKAKNSIRFINFVFNSLPQYYTSIANLIILHSIAFDQDKFNYSIHTIKNFVVLVTCAESQYYEKQDVKAFNIEFANSLDAIKEVNNSTVINFAWQEINC